MEEDEEDDDDVEPNEEKDEEDNEEEDEVTTRGMKWLIMTIVLTSLSKSVIKRFSQLFSMTF